MDSFTLDPLEGERTYPEEPIYAEYLHRLALGGAEYRFAGGRTEMEPAHRLVVGCSYDVRFTYFPEDADLAEGTVVAFSIPRTWTQPHCDDPSSPGYVSAERSGGAVEVALSQNENLQWWIKARVHGGPEPTAGWVRVTYGAVAVQRFPQSWFGNWRSAMRCVVDQGGAGEYACVPAARTAKPTIVAAPPARFHVASPAVAKPGRVITVRFAALDYCDNPAWPPPTGGVFAAWPHDPYTPVAEADLTADDLGRGELRVTLPADEPTCRVIVSNRKDKLRGLSSPTLVTDDPDALNVYFGDTHAKTMLSDGLKTPAEYFVHARDVALSDFSAIADHNCFEASRVEGPFRTQMSDDAFAEIQSACEAFNEPGRFVTLQGFEQNQIEGYPGHRNVYFRGICPGLFRGRTLEQLYDYLEGHAALIIPHHPLIWNTRVHLGNPRYERVLEMYSMHCSSEVKGGPVNNWRTTANKAETGLCAWEILGAGHRVGFIASSDNHNGAPGLSARPSRFTNICYSGGLAAVFAPRLCREDVFDALYNRRCYATTGARIYLDFRLGGEMMGAELTVERGGLLPYRITVAGTDRISRIELVQNGVEDALWTHDGADYARLEGQRKFDGDTWLYVRVTQADRHMAWSSPVWVDVR